MENKSIIFLTPGFPANEHDTTCIPALQIFIKAFNERNNWQFYVITMQYPFRPGWYTWHGIPVYSCGGRNEKWRMLGSILKSWRIVSDLKKKHANLMVHSYWIGFSSLVGSVLSRWYDLPHSCTIMGRDVFPDNVYWRLFNRCQCYISLSKFHYNSLQQAHGLPSIIIPWGLPNLAEYNVEKDIDLIAVSSLINSKALDEFVQVVHLVQKAYPALRALIVGAGPSRKALEDQLVQLNLEHCIQLSGVLPHNETLNRIARSRILLHLSSFESFGMVTIEALALRTYVVSKPVGIAVEVEEVHKVRDWRDAVEVILDILINKEVPQQILWSVDRTVKEYETFFNRKQLK